MFTKSSAMAILFTESPVWDSLIFIPSASARHKLVQLCSILNHLRVDDQHLLDQFRILRERLLMLLWSCPLQRIFRVMPPVAISSLPFCQVRTEAEVQSIGSDFHNLLSALVSPNAFARNVSNKLSRPLKQRIP